MLQQILHNEKNENNIQRTRLLVWKLFIAILFTWTAAGHVHDTIPE